MDKPKKEKKKTANETWISNRSQALRFLKEMKVDGTTDRLIILRNWMTTFNFMGESMSGWMQWLNNIMVMESMDKKTMSKLFLKYKNLVEQFIAFDVEATELVSKEPEISKGITPSYVA